jgi:HicA toxin of bacterial toxin-antitoxin,
MSKAQKATDRLSARPTDYEWRELESLMTSFGYRLEKGGGSGRKFIHKDTKVIFMIHEPHPSKVLKRYAIKNAIDFLKQEKHIK